MTKTKTEHRYPTTHLNPLNVLILSIFGFALAVLVVMAASAVYIVLRVQASIASNNSLPDTLPVPPPMRQTQTGPTHDFYAEHPAA